MKPGMASMPWRSMTLVLGPIHWSAARSAPRAVILLARTARACAVGAAGFMVTILPLRRTRSAGWARRDAAKAARMTGGDTRIPYRILIPGGARPLCDAGGVQPQACYRM